jgi:hypothetical protein
MCGRSCSQTHCPRGTSPAVRAMGPSGGQVQLQPQQVAGQVARQVIFFLGGGANTHAPPLPRLNPNPNPDTHTHTHPAAYEDSTGLFNPEVAEQSLHWGIHSKKYKEARKRKAEEKKQLEEAERVAKALEKAAREEEHKQLREAVYAATARLQEERKQWKQQQWKQEEKEKERGKNDKQRQEKQRALIRELFPVDK